MQIDSIIAVLISGASLSNILIAALILMNIASALFAITYFYYLNPHRGEVSANVTLIMALTGKSSNLKNLLHRLNAQTLQPTQLLIGIESKEDPAYQMVMQMKVFAAFPIKVAIAGPSEFTAQKCHNQLAAASLISKDSQHHIVLLDADIDPPNWWLAALIKPIENKVADLVSGYRWQQPNSYDLGSHLITFIDRSIAVLPKLTSASMIWGGSIAMRYKVFESVLQHKVLASTITDDLAIANHARKMNFKILMRRVLLAPSPTPSGLLSGLRFGVRQYQIIKIHRPVIWTLALIVSIVSVVGWVALISAFIATLISFELNQSEEIFRHATNYFYLLMSIYFCTAVKMIFLYKVSKKIDLKSQKKLWFFQLLLILIKPFIDLIHCLMILRSSNSSLVHWGHVTYQVNDISSIQVFNRTRP